MGEYSLEEYYNMFRALSLADENVNRAAVIYRNMFPEAFRNPSPAVFTRLRARLLKTGNLLPDYSNAGAPKTAMTPQLEARILAEFDEDNNLSTRLCATRLGIPNHTTVHDVLVKNGRHPYRFKKVQELIQARDYVNRFNFCIRMLQQARLLPDLWDLILWSDECMFSTKGMFNAKNYVTWSDYNPFLTIETNSQFRWTINVWLGLIGDKVVSFSC